MIEMNQNINQLISKLFRSDFRTVTLLQNHMKFLMAKQIVDGGHADRPILMLRTRKLVDRIYLNFMRR